jgi:hypothetical protein
LPEGSENGEVTRSFFAFEVALVVVCVLVFMLEMNLLLTALIGFALLSS